MTPEEALAILGVGSNATLTEIEEAYRSKSKSNHPDANNGEGTELQLELNLAREVATASMGTELVWRQALGDISSLRKEVVAQNARQESESFSDRLIKLRTQPIQNIKYFSFLAAAISGLFSFISNDVAVTELLVNLPLFPAPFAEHLVTSIKLGAIFFAVCGGILHFIVEHQKHLVEKLKGRLSDEFYCAKALQYEGVNTAESFTLYELLRKFPEVGVGPIPFFAVSRRERVELTVLKALELGILERPNGSRLRIQVSEDAKELFSQTSF